MSRTTSASTRKRGPRASRRFSGSRASNSGVTFDDCRYVAEVTISFCIRFTSQPRADELRREPIEQFGMRRVVALHAEILRRLHQPVPKYCCQKRFTVTRAVSG